MRNREEGRAREKRGERKRERERASEKEGGRAGKRRDRDSETRGVYSGGREKAKGSYLVVSQLANFQ